jgi:hypothetical protein
LCCLPRFGRCFVRHRGGPFCGRWVQRSVRVTMVCNSHANTGAPRARADDVSPTNPLKSALQTKY